MRDTKILITRYCRILAAVAVIVFGTALTPAGAFGTVIKYTLYTAAALIAGLNFKSLTKAPPVKDTVFGCALILSFSILLSFLPLKQTSTDTNSTLFILTALVFAPVFEELFFRGGLIFFDSLPSTCLMSALIFGTFHGPSAFFQTAVLGAVLSLLYARTRSIYVPIICHFANNLLAIICMRYDIRIWVLIPSALIVFYFVYARRKNEKKIL